MKYIIGIDLGTSGTKCVLFDETGKAVCSATYNYDLIQPQNGWAEQDPKAWVTATIKGLKDIVNHSKIDTKKIVSIGLSGQMHGIVLLDDNNQVLRNAIIWCDQRPQTQCDELNNHFGTSLIEMTGNPALTGFSLAKILWVKQNEPHIFQQVKKILLPKDYLRLILTKEFFTEYSDVSGMQLISLKSRQYEKKLLEYLDINESYLPKIVESSAITGYLTTDIVNETKLSSIISVVAGASDNAAAALGCGVMQNKETFLTIGTSGVLYIHTKDLTYDIKGRFHTFCAAVPNEYHIMGVTQAAGLSLQWLRNNLFTEEYQQHGEDFYHWLFDQIKDIPIGANKLIYLPYLMGERTPHLDSDVRGMFWGLSAKHNKFDMAKAVIEGVTYSIKDCLACFNENSIKIDTLYITGGGARSKIWSQMFSDCLGAVVKTVDNAEGPALGVAVLAAVGAGIYDNLLTAKRKMIKEGPSVFKPNLANQQKYDKVFALYQKLYQVNKVAFKDLNNI